MANMPVAEVDVTVALVRQLLNEQHPDLAGLELTVVTNGWDNVMLRLGPQLAVRVPRRKMAAQLVENEQRWLPELAPDLPVAVPAPVRVGVASAALGYPWSWSVVPWFDGLPAYTVEPARRTVFARPLARFLVALHRPAPADAPHNPVRGGPLVGHMDAFMARTATLPHGSMLREVMFRVIDTPAWDREPRWLHGDLHPANILATGATSSAHAAYLPGAGVAGNQNTAGLARGAGMASSTVELRAVIDFGDITAGDPATDLATAWLTFDAAGRAGFRDVMAASGMDNHTWDRALGWATHLTAALLAHSDDAPHLRAIGEHALAQVLQDV